MSKAAQPMDVLTAMILCALGQKRRAPMSAQDIVDAVCTWCVERDLAPEIWDWIGPAHIKTRCSALIPGGIMEGGAVTLENGRSGVRWVLRIDRAAANRALLEAEHVCRRGIESQLRAALPIPAALSRTERFAETIDLLLTIVDQRIAEVLREIRAEVCP